MKRRMFFHIVGIGADELIHQLEMARLVLDKDREIVAVQSGIYPLKPHFKNLINCIRTPNNTNGNIVEEHNSAVLIHMANTAYRCKT